MLLVFLAANSAQACLAQSQTFGSKASGSIPGSKTPGSSASSNSRTVPIGNVSVSGSVSDSKNVRKIGEAHVVLAKIGEEHKRYEMHTGEDGLFNFDKVLAGNYTLTVSAKDMISHTLKLSLKSGESKDLKIGLEDLENVDVLRVSGKRTLIHPEKIGSETTLDHKFVYQYKTGNDLKDLITSTPGVMNDSFGNIISRGEHNAINYEIDGVVIPEAAGVLQQSQPISPRSLQSMTVDIGGYEASDGGGPLGAVAHMKSLPLAAKRNFSVGQQIGGPMAGSIYYNGSGAFSLDPNSIWNKFRMETSGSFRGSSYRLAPPVKNYVNNNAVDINSFTKVEFQASERDVFRLTTAINDTFTQLPTSTGTRRAGFHGKQHDAQDYIIASYIHKFEKHFDQLDLHLFNGLYYEKFHTSLAFDPYPNFNNGQPLYSIATNATRYNYIFSAQGNLTKTIKKEHHLKAGFLSEYRPVRTTYNAVYYNADLVGSLQQQAAAQGTIASLNDQIDATNAGINAANATGDSATAANLSSTLSGLQSQLSAQSPNPFPYGALISPFTGQLGGPQFLGPLGRFEGSRFLQSAFIQDKYTPQNGFWKRLTLDGGVRFDMQRSFYGNALPLASTIASIPGVQPFSLQPYLAQARTDAQASGRYGATFVLAKNTVIRGSYSDLFVPNPVDYFLTPYNVTGTPTNGVFDGTPRPLHATRGQLVDSSIEKQIGPRFATRTNLFYKYLTNFGDSGVVGNLPLYNRLTNSAQDAYGVETRIDLKPSKDGYGFNGFLSNTVQVAYLRGTKTPSGGFFATPTTPSMKFPDHDRRLSNIAGIGYKTRHNIWSLLTVQVLSGLQDERDQTLSGPHNARTPFFTNVSLSTGYQPPKKLLKKCAYLPNALDLRIENMLNQRVPINLGSPFQGTRYNLPIRVLVGCSWQLGPEEAKLSAKPASNSIRSLSKI